MKSEGDTMEEVKQFLADMGVRIFAQRKRLGITQEALAEKADVSPQLISAVENGIRAVSSDKLFRISRALHVSADYLMSGEISESDKFLLGEKLKNATSEQLQAIDKITDIILNL